MHFPRAQAFEFELDELKEHVPNLRLYIALMASLPISKDGSGFLGCMSFSVADLVSQSTESLPKLFWLLNKTQGISRYVPVEHAILDGDSLDATMEISGRKTTLSNSWVCCLVTSPIPLTAPQINGFYLQQPVKEGARERRPKQTKSGTRRAGIDHCNNW